MALTSKDNLVALLTPPVDHFLAVQYVDEFISLERRYILRDWEPAELNGGQFCEILARIIYHVDSGNLNRAKEFRACIDYIEEEKNRHFVQPRHNAIHLASVIKTIYKFRSQRGAVHISPNYKANHLDSKFIVESARWCFSESLRVFCNTDREKTAHIIREIIQFDVPCVGNYDNRIMVQRTDLKAEEEILILLHYAGENGLSRSEIGQHAMFSPSSISAGIKKLSSPSMRQIIKLSNSNYRLTDLGEKRIRDQLAEKLTLS